MKDRDLDQKCERLLTLSKKDRYLVDIMRPKLLNIFLHAPLLISC